tara:strand:- start:4323 stop:4664 length:342 start_codon:yes stop_codon:yes gene_type:complete
MTTIAEDFCMECDDQNANECTNECNDMCCLTDSMNALNFNNNNINTIVIVKLAEKLTREMNYSKTFIKEKKGYMINIDLPEWFYDLDIKYQNILFKLIQPVLNHYIVQENANN